MAEGGFDNKHGSDISGKMTRITICSAYLLWLKFAVWIEQSPCCLKMKENALNMMTIRDRTAIVSTIFDANFIWNKNPSKILLEIENPSTFMSMFYYLFGALIHPQVIVHVGVLIIHVIPKYLDFLSWYICVFDMHVDS